ncbi:MAG TPA: hypothetical protein ENJ09_15995 [Planctomycetes bacterium]|nr:hypothetical protein [Planctomycetota bacterium]
MSEPVPHSITGDLARGIRAGLALALAEALATGLDRIPATLTSLLLVFGVILGLVAGAVAALASRSCSRAPSPLAVTLAIAAFLDGGARLSNGPGLSTSWLLLLAALSLATLRAAAPLRPGLPLAFALTATIPGGPLLAVFLPSTTANQLVPCALPLAAALLARTLGRGRAERLGHLGQLALALLVATALAAPARILDPAPRRPDRRPLPDAAQAPPDAPDVVLVLVDTLRVDAAGDAGALARLAREGVRFTTAISTAPWTLPSTGSILTGLLPSEHGATSITHPLPREVETIAERFARAGYRTAAFTGGGFVRPEFGLDDGFEHFDSSVELGFRPFRIHIPLPWRLLKNRYLTSDRLVSWVGEYLGSEGLARAALADWRERDPERPSFLLLHTYEVHDYYLRRPELDGPVGPVPAGHFAGRFSIHPSELQGASAEELHHFERIYRHRARHTADVLDKLLEDLGSDSRRGMIVALTSDHGEGFDAERHRVHHGGRLQEDLLRVPMILRAPGRLPAGAEISQAVSTIDLVPTLLDLAGLDTDGDLPGRSLVPLAQGEPAADEEIWSEERANRRSLLALRRGEWKALREGDRYWAFHIAADPLEDHPLEVPAELAERLAAFSTLFPARTAPSVPLDSGALGHLRNLGYVE